MDLRDLLAGVPIRDASPDLPRDVTGAGYDSHTIQPGQAFVAIHGAAADGHDYTALARQRGASCAISTHPVEGLPYVIVPDTRAGPGPDSRKLLPPPGPGAAPHRRHRHQRKNLRGLADGRHAPGPGHTDRSHGHQRLPHRGHGPPLPPHHPRILGGAASAAANGRFRVHLRGDGGILPRIALDRVCGLAYTIAAFTNLSRDHLDFHGTMDRYAQAKSALFRQCGQAAVNRDDPWASRVLRGCVCPVYGYGIRSGDLRAEDVVLSPAGVRFTAREGASTVPAAVPIPGMFTVYNTLAALSIARLSGISLADAAKALGQSRSVPGRMEPIPVPGRGYRVFIDFAHTPDAIENALKTARSMTSGRLIAVFGCGGGRDPGKRPLMGAAASRYADLTILTSDNPRTEDPLAIIRDILPGITGSHQVVPDRREAIFRALSLARSGDTVLLCGKGHETTQETDGKLLPLDERQIIAEYINGS